MNVLVYTYLYPAPDKYHIPKDTLVIRYFVDMLKKKGHHVQVVRLFYWPSKEISLRHINYIVPHYADYELNNVPVHLIRYQMMKPRRIYPGKWQAKQINRHLNKWKQEIHFKPDRVFVHFPSFFSGLDEIFRDTSAVMCDAHNMDVANLTDRDKDGTGKSFIQKIHTLGYRNVRVEQYFKTHFPDQSAVRTYTGIEAEYLASPDEIETKKHRKRAHMRILYVGQLLPLKNVDVLIQAVEKLDFDTELTIVGDGPEMNRLRSLANEAGNIHFTGWVERGKAVELMESADVFVMVSSPETYGMVYLEAMAKGTVPVGAYGEGFDGIIRDGENGFLVQPRDVDLLAEKLQHIRGLSDEQWHMLIENAFNTACSLTEDKVTDMYLQSNVT